jgi:hypothetical protein
LLKDVDLERKPSSELVVALRHPNKWHRQTAVRLLGERRDPLVQESLLKLLEQERGVHPALEALWALHQCGWLNDATATKALETSCCTRSVRGQFA